MSWVSNAVLMSERGWPYFIKPLEKKGWAKVDQYAGGTKVFESSVYLKAFNHTTSDEILEEVLSAFQDRKAYYSAASGLVLIVYTEDSENNVAVWKSEWTKFYDIDNKAEKRLQGNDINTRS